MRLAAVAVVLLAGCAKLLGLDDTQFAPQDATPSVCVGPAPACAASTGRSICGQLVAVGVMAGTPLRSATPTGQVCTAGGDGPCAFELGEQPLAMMFAGHAPVPAGTIDDCGRYAIVDTDASQADVAVSLTGGFTTAALLLGRPSTIGQIDTLDLLAVTTSDQAAWNTEIASVVTSGYLVQYDASGLPRIDEQAAISGGNPLSTTPSTTAPFVAYFGDLAFGTLAPAATGTGAGGTALVVPSSPPSTVFDLQGFRAGHRCTIPGVQTVPSTLVSVVLPDC